MKVTWFAVDCNIYTHPKVQALAAALKLDVDTVVGKLGRLWGWAKQAGNETGDICFLPDQEIADIMRWRKKASVLVQALVECGFLDMENGRKFLHGWQELNGGFAEKRRKDNERKRGGNSVENPRNFHGKSTEIPAVPYHTIPDHTVSLPPDGGKETGRAPVPAPVPAAEERRLPDTGAVAAVLKDYLDRINPAASQGSLDELREFALQLGEAVCKRAFDVALDGKKANWPYIRGILRSKSAQGVRCLADWDALEAQREKDAPPNKRDPKSGYYGGDLDPEILSREVAWMDEFLQEETGGEKG